MSISRIRKFLFGDPDSKPSLRPIRGEGDFQEALAQSEDGPVLIFKHSSACGTSYFARNEVERLTDDGDPAVFEVVVQRNRPMSDQIASFFSVRHASPQALLLRGRDVVWNASHGGITVEAVRNAAMRVATVLLVLLLAGCGPDSGEPATSQPESARNPNEVIVGSQSKAEEAPAPAPDFTLPTSDGSLYSLSESRGRVVVINFWATWCGPCVRETPAFVDLQTEWQDRPFEIVGVSEDAEGFEVVRPFIDRYGVQYPMVVDDGSLADAFGGVYAMPSTFIIDKEGRIAHRVVGEFPFEDLRDELERLMDA